MAKNYVVDAPLEVKTVASAPVTPAAGSVVLYVKTDGLLYSKDEAGVEKRHVSGAGFFVFLAQNFR